MTEMVSRYAPEGKIFVCMTCFAKTKDLGDWVKNPCCFYEAQVCDEVQPAPGFYAVTAAEPR